MVASIGLRWIFHNSENLERQGNISEILESHSLQLESRAMIPEEKAAHRAGWGMRMDGPGKNRCAHDRITDSDAAWLLARGGGMHRDDDYLRQVLVDMASAKEWLFKGPYLSMGATDAQEKEAYHMLLLIDGGLLVPVGASGGTVRMTNQGHDFLANTSIPENWETVKAIGRKTGNVSVGILAKIAEAVIMQKLRDMGVPV
ncbi:MAG: hypothetical protein ACOH2H_16045 [Cypionkella sp.]